jgi:hypothetical protein
MEAVAPVGQRGGDKPGDGRTSAPSGMDRRGAPHGAAPARLGTPIAAVVATDIDPVRAPEKVRERAPQQA